MAYIHSSPVGVHGRLKSTNVVVDSNWCCKLTDLAMPRFRAGEKGLETHTRQYYWSQCFRFALFLCVFVCLSASVSAYVQCIYGCGYL